MGRGRLLGGWGYGEGAFELCDAAAVRGVRGRAAQMGDCGYLRLLEGSERGLEGAGRTGLIWLVRTAATLNRG